MNNIEIINDKEIKYKVSELIKIKLLEHRSYIFRENFDYFRDKYFTETPDKDIKVINDYEIDIFNFKENLSSAIIWEEETQSFYKVDLIINITDLYMDDTLRNIYLENYNKSYNVFLNKSIKELKLSDIKDKQISDLLDDSLEIEIIKTIKID